MKYIFLAILIVTTFCGCNYQKNSDEKVKTFVVELGRAFYVSKKNQVPYFCFLFKPKKYGMDVEITSYDLVTSTWPTERKYPNGAECLSELDECLQYASKIYNFDSLQHIIGFTSYFIDYAIIDMHAINYYNYSSALSYYKDVDKALSSTLFMSKIDSILSKHNLKVDSINAELGGRKYMMQTRKQILKNYKISPKTHLPDSVLLVPFTLTIESKTVTTQHP